MKRFLVSFLAVAILLAASVSNAAGPTLTVNTSDPLMGWTMPAGPIGITYGDPNDITAFAMDGYRFVNWTIDSGTAMIANENLPDTTVTCTTDATVTAHFEMLPAVLRIFSTPDGEGMTVPYSPAGVMVEFNDDIPISATPVPGFVFQNWEDFGCTPGIADKTLASTTINLAPSDGDNFVAALFAPSFQWAKRSTGGTCELRSMKADASGNVLVTGRINGNTTFGSFTLTRAGLQDMFIARYNSSGTCTMAINPACSTSDNINPTGLAVDSLGNIYVGGTFTNDLTFASGMLTAGSDSHFVAKFNSAGAIQWVKQINEISTTSEWLVADTEGNVYLTGSFMSPTILTIGAKTANPAGILWNAFLAKLDTNGNCTWIKTAGADGIEVHSLAVAVIPDGSSSVIGGYVANPGSVNFGSFPITSVNESRMFLAVYDASGTCVNAMNSDSSTGGTASLMALDFDAYGDIYFVGVNTGEISLAGNELPDDLDPFDQVNIGKLEPDGTGMWMYQLPEIDSMGPVVSLAVDGVGNAYVSSTIDFSTPDLGVFGDFSLYDNHSGLYIAKYDAGGDCYLAKKVTTVYSPGGTVRDYGIDIDASGNVYLAGMLNPEGVNLDVATFMSSQDVFIAKLPGADNYVNLKLELGTADSAQIGPMAGTMSVLKGEPFTISADITKGYHFVNWAVTSGSPVIADANALETTVTLTGNATVTLNAAINTGTFHNLYVYPQFEKGTSSPYGVVQVYSDEWKEISATPIAGYHFVNWTQTGTNNATFGNANLPQTRVKITGQEIITANFAADGTSYALTPAVSGAGTTTPEHPVLVSAGEPRFISAEAGSGYHFVNWTAGAGASIVDSTSPETYATLTANATVTAHFAPNTAYNNLTIVSNPSFGGTTNQTTVSVPAGEPYQISATAAYGYHFTGWTAPANVTFTDALMSTTYVRLTGDATVTANFATGKTVFLTTNVSGDGSVTPSGRTAYTTGETIQISAVAGAGAYFVNWTGSAGNVIFANEGLPQTTILITGNDTITANFAPADTVDLTLAVDPPASGTTTPDAGTSTPVDLGKAVNIVAVPGDGYRFLEWSVDSGLATIENVSSENTFAYHRGGDTTITAHFYNRTTITVVAEPEGAGTVTPSTPQENTPVDFPTAILATPLSGYEFVEWRYDTMDTDIHIKDDNRFLANTTVSIKKPATITAVFKYSAVTLNMASLPTFGGTTDPGTGPALFPKTMVDIPISAIPVQGYVFQNWDNSVNGGTVIADLVSPATTITLGPDEYEADVTAFFAPAFQWAKRTTGDSNNQPYGIKINASGDAIVVGSMSANATFGSIDLTMVGAQDIYIAKYDSSGTCTMAVNPASTDGWFYPSSMVLDHSGNIYVGGNFSGTATFGATTLTGDPGNYFIAKFDSAGVVQWVTQKDDFSPFSSELLAVDAAGHVYLTGSFMMATLKVGSETVEPTGAMTNVFLAKIDGDDGSCTWIKPVGIDGVEIYGLAIAVNADGNPVIGGRIFGDGEVDFGGFTVQGDPTRNRIFIVSYDANGNCLSAKNSTGGDASIRTLRFDAAGNLYFAGTNSGAIGLGGINLPDDASGNMENNLGKIDATGSVLWMNQLPAADMGGNIALAVDSSSNAFVSTRFSSWSGGNFGNFRLYDSLDGLYLAKYDAGGVCQFAKKVIGPVSGEPRLYGIDVDATGNLYMAGRIGIDNVNLDVETFISTDADTFLAKMPGPDNFANLTLALGTADSAEISPMIGTISVLKGEPFSISAEISKGYHFVNWTKSGATAAIANANTLETTVTLTGDATVTLNASLNTGTFYNLVVATVGNGTVSPSETVPVYSDEWKEISATAAAGSHFVNWTKTAGATLGNENSPETHVKLTANSTVTAHFAVDGASFTLTPAVTGSGSTTPAHPVLVSSGEPMFISAQAGAGYHFVNWTAGAGSTIIDVNSPETYAALSANSTITANFAPNTAYYNLTIVSNPVMGGTTSETTVAVASGESFKISAAANDGYHFKNWTTPLNATFANANFSTTYVRLSGDARVTANFACNKTVFLDLQAVTGGTVSPSGRTALSVGESFDIAAVPASGSFFVNWTVSGNATVANPGLASTSVVLEGDATVTAIFDTAGTADLTLYATAGGETDPTNGFTTSFIKGDAVTIKASPYDGYRFVNWSIDSGAVTIEDANSAVTNVYLTGTAIISANFVNTATLTVLSEPAGAGTVTPANPQEIQINLPTPITATPARGYEFVGWTFSGNATLGDPDPTVNPNTVMITDDASVIANFRYTKATLHMASIPTVGGTTNPPAGAINIDKNVDVPISAIPIAGYRFQNWLKPVCFAPGIDDTNLMNASTTIKIDTVDEEVSATAIFAPSFRWAKRSNGMSSQMRSIKADASGNVFVAGIMNGDTAFGTTTLTMGGTQDLFMAKYNSAGTCTMAVNPAFSTAEINPTGLAVDVGGNIYVGGTFIGDATFGATTLLDAGNSHFVAKYNSTGVLKWVKQIDEINTTSEWLVADKAGNVYLSGSFLMPTLTIGTETVDQIGMMSNSFLAKLNTSGACSWIRTAGSADFVDVRSLAVAVDSEGNTAIGGTLMGDGAVSFGSFTVQGDLMNNRMFLASYDAGGNCLGAMNSTGESASIMALDFDAEGNLCFAGVNKGGISFGGAELPDDWSGSDEVNLGRISPDGTVAWMKQLATLDPGNQNVSLAVDAAGNAYVSSLFGYSGAWPVGAKFGDITLHDWNNGLYMAKYDANGECLFAKKVTSIFSAGIDRTYGIDVDGGGNCILSGTMSAFEMIDLDVDVFSSDSDVFIAKLPGAASYANLTLALGTADSAEISPMSGTISVLKGEPFSISAEIGKGYHFVNWTRSSTKAILGDANSLETTVTLTGDATVTLNTALNTSTFYDLTMDVSGDGAVSPSGTIKIYSDEWVEISATAMAGSHFVNWTAEAGATLVNANSPETHVKLTANATVTANFAVDGVLVTLTPAVSGSGSVLPAHPVSLNSGAPVLISAEAGAGYHFLKWTVTSGTAVIIVSTSPETYATLTTDSTITANFEANSAVYCRLSQVANPAYGGTVDGGIVTLASGEPYQISATAASGYHFTGWTFADTNATFTDANASPTYVRLTGDATVTANFATNQTVFLTTAVSGNGTVTPSGLNALSIGESMQITAVPDLGYYFSGWTVSPMGSATVANTLLANTSVVLTGDATVTANFAAAGMADLTMTVSGNGTTMPGNMSVGKSVPLPIDAIPDPGNRFLYWKILSGNAAIDDVNSASTTVYITGNATIQATFSNQATLTMFTEPAGAGTVSPGATQVIDVDDPPFTIPTPIVATPNSGYEFVGWTWSGPATISDDTLASTDVLISDNASVTAHFKYTQATLHIASLPSTDGTTNPATGTLSVNRNEPIGLSAISGAGYVFQNWDNPGIMVPDDLVSPSAYAMLDDFTDEASVNAIFAPSFQWAKRTTGDSNNEPRSIKTDSSGNVIVTGVMSSNATFGTTTLTLVPPALQDIYIAKYDSAGICKLAKNPASSDVAISVKAMALDPSGNIYVAGDFTGKATFGATTLTAAMDSHFVAKFSPAGAALWAKQINEMTITSESLAVDAAGNVYLTGSFMMLTLDIGGVTAEPVGGMFNVFLAKLNTSGACQWIERAGADGVDLWSLAIAVDPSGNVAIGGMMLGWGTVSFGSFSVESSWDDRMFIATYNAAGTCIGAMNSTGGKSVSIKSLAFDNVGNLYFTGTNEGGFSLGGFTLPDDGLVQNEFNLGKLSGGTVEWIRQLPMVDMTGYMPLSVDDAGNAYVSASFMQANGADFGSIKLYDVFDGLYIAKYNTSGVCAMAKKIIGASATDPRSFDIDVDLGGNLFMAGRIGADNINLDVDNFTSAGADTFITMIAGAGSVNLTMAVSPVGTGTVTPSAGTVPVLKGEPIHISADGVSGYRFVNWTNTPSAAVTNASASATTATLTGNATVTANFARNKATLEIAISGNGITEPAVWAVVEHDAATAIPIVATPGDKFHFVEWNVASGIATIANPNAASTTVTLEGANGSAVVLNAVFAHDVANLTMAVNGDGIVDPVPGIQSFDTGTVVAITATNGLTGIFKNWTVTGNATLGAAADVNANTVMLNGNATVTANFYDSNNDMNPPADDVSIAGDVAGSSKVFRIVGVPVGTTYLKVWTTDAGGASGDCDIYAKPGEIPSTADYYAKSTKVGWDELIEVTSPVVGDWYVLVYGYDDYSNVDLHIECGTAADGVPMKPVMGSASDDLPDRVKVDWTVDPADGANEYRVYRAKVNSSTLAVAVGEPIPVSAGETAYSYEDIFPAGTFCQYYYWVRAKTTVLPPQYSAFSNSALGSNTDASDPTVIKGTVKLSGAEGSIRRYKIAVPKSSAAVPQTVLLDIKTSGGTGDCDLEVVRDDGTSELKYSRNPGNSELVRYDPPTDGVDVVYVISVIGKSNYAGVSLLATLYTKAPKAPKAIASDGTYSDMIIVSWKDSPGASTYEVWRHDSKLKSGIDTTATKLGETSDLTYVDTGIPDITKTYYYWVKAKNATLSSVFGACDSGYVTKEPVIPKKVTASAGKYFDKILVTWPGVSGATSYLLYRSEDDPNPLSAGASFAEIQAVGGAKSYSYEDMGDDAPLSIDSTYYYWVQAKNDNGTSDFGAYGTGTLSKAAPGSVAASDGTYYQSVMVTWAAVPGATTYNIYRNEEGDAPAYLDSTLDDSTSFLDLTVDAATKYFYSVEADYNDIYQSSISTSNSGYAAITTPTTLTAPVIKTASKGEHDYILITWGVVPLADEYIVYKDGGDPHTVTDLFYKDTDAGLVPGTLYAYTVVAHNTSTDAFSNPSKPMSGYRGLDTNNLPAPDGYTEVANDSKMFDFEVLPGTSRLVVTAEYATTDGSCDIYAKVSSYPTTSSYNAKGAKLVVGANTVDTLTVNNPLSGQWYVLLNETTAAFNATITIHLYTATNIILTTVPSDNLAAPFTATFKGQVLDQDGTGIKDVQVKVRNPLTKMTYNLAKKTDASGYWTYTASIACEGEHTFDFFIGTYPEEGLASWTVKTRKLLGSEDTFFDMSEYLTGTKVDLADAATMEGMETYLNLRRGYDEVTVTPDSDYEAMWFEDSMSAASSDTEITDRLDSGLYFLLYGFEGAACGNGQEDYEDIGFNFTASPLLVRVAPGKVDEVIDNLLDAGLVDNVFVERVVGADGILTVDDVGIGVVVVGSRNIEGKNSGLLSTKEQFELLAKLAGNSTLTVQAAPEKAGDMITWGVQSDINGGAAKFNVQVGAFTK